MTVDFRDLDRARLDELGRAVTAAARDVAAARALPVDVDLARPIPPCPLDGGIQRIIAGSAAARGLVASAMPSGAGHDSQNLAGLAPTGMIFVPSVGGRSHCPDEYTTRSDAENGANVLLDTVIGLAGR